VSNSFWGHIFAAPLLWWRSLKVKKALQGLGMGAQGASVAAALIREEVQLKQKIQFLEVANAALKRWLVIHKPIGYAIYILGALHIILVTVLA
jgi:hypothetical protein